MKPIQVVICRANPVAPDPRVEKIAQALHSFGYSIQIVGWNISGQFPDNDVFGDIPLVRLHIVAHFGRGWRNILHQLRWQWALFSWLFRHRSEINVIHACDFDTVLPALLMRSLAGKRVIYDIFDFYADMLRATPAVLKALLRRMELAAINRVDAVILADERRLQQIAGAHPRRIEYIYNSPSDVQITDLSKISSEDSLRVAYVGNLQIQRGLLELLDVLSRHPNWKLDLAGFGPDETEILKQACELPNVTWHGRVPYHRALEINARADIMIATYDPRIPNHRYSSPNKLFEAMMLGRPVIVARQTNIDGVVESVQCGLVVDYGDISGLEGALQKMTEDEEFRKTCGAHARLAYLQSYGWNRMSEKLRTLYKDVVGA